MAVFKVETKNKVDIDKKPRVYFTCHPDDFEKHFKKVCDGIFKTHDCAIYYTEDMTEVIAEDEKQVDLGRNNLFVVPVTFKLLTSPNRAMDEDILYALKEHIPVLPIMMEPGIDEFYSKSDKFGELQYLNPYSTDLTEISYEEKLKKYLESVLISDELAKRVRAAFDAYIFLSYRKKDRKYANALMRLIHSNPECRDIAIWFDEFLTPGESFKENIEKILDDCKLFTLLVTPQLLEKVVDENGEERDNYVISTELPLAQKKKEEKGTDIFAVEMEKTDRESLSAISIDDYTNPENADFRERLLETISRMAITTNNTPEHNFLIGLAYLEGIDVEVDQERAVELITLAAEAGLPEAINIIVSVYRLGIGVNQSYEEAIKWQKKLIERIKALLLEGDEKYNEKQLFSAMHVLAGYIFEKKDLKEAYTAYKDLRDICKAKIDNKELITLSQSFYLAKATEGMADVTIELGEISLATELYMESLALKRSLLHFCKESFLTVEIINGYIYWGDVLFDSGNKSKAKDMYYKAKDFIKEEIIDYMSHSLRRSLILIHERLGDLFENIGEFSTAMDMYLIALSISEQVAQETSDDLDYQNLSNIYERIGNINYDNLFFSCAKNYYEKSFDIRKKLNEKLKSFSTEEALSMSYVKLGDFYTAISEFDKSIKMYKKSLDIRKELALKSGAKKNLEDLAKIYLKLGNSLTKVSKIDIAIKMYQKSIDINMQLLEKTKLTEYQKNIAIIYENLGIAYENKSDIKAALVMFEQANDILNNFVQKTDDINAQKHLAFCNKKIGDVAFSIGLISESIEMYIVAIHLLEELVSKVNALDVRRELSIYCEKLADVYNHNNMYFESIDMYKKSLEIRKALLKENNLLIFRREVAISYERLGNIYKQINNLDEAKQMYQYALNVRKEIVNEITTSESLEDLFISFSKMGLINIALNSISEAKMFYKKALEIAEKRNGIENTAKSLDALAMAHFNLSKVSTDEESEENNSEAYNIWSMLARKYPTVSKYSIYRDMAKRNI